MRPQRGFKAQKLQVALSYLGRRLASTFVASQHLKSVRQGRTPPDVLARKAPPSTMRMMAIIQGMAIFQKMAVFHSGFSACARFSSKSSNCNAQHDRWSNVARVGNQVPCGSLNVDCTHPSGNSLTCTASCKVKSPEACSNRQGVESLACRGPNRRYSDTSLGQAASHGGGTDFAAQPRLWASIAQELHQD